MFSSKSAGRPFLVLSLGFICFAAQLKADAQSPHWVDPTGPQLATQRGEILAAMDRLGRILDLTPDGVQWRVYFLWNDLQRAIDPSVNVDPEKLSNSRNDLLAVYAKLADDHAGLERDEVQSLRAAIRIHIRQINALLVRRGEREAIARRERIDALVAANRWTATAQSEYAQHLRWLDDHLQPPAAKKIGSDGFNLISAISGDFIRQATLTPVSDPADVNECIVGTRVVGSGMTTGTGWLSPVTSNNGARLEANFQGVLHSDTVGFSGPVRIYSDGQTQLRGTALLELDSSGLRRLSSRVDASADSQTKGISTKFNGLLDRIVKKVARRKIAESKPQANRESSFKAKQSFTERFEKDIHQQVDDGNDAFLKFLRLPLLRRDLTPARWNWTTSSTSLNTAVGFDGRDRPLCVVRPPKPNQTRPVQAIEVSVHQSFLDNAVEGYLGGRLQTLSSILPQEEGKEASEDEKIAVRLDDFQPIRCIFDNDMMTFYLLAKQIIANGNEYPGVVIKVAYRIQRDVDGDELIGLKLVRDADPTVEPIPTFSRPPKFGFQGSAIRVAVEPVLQEELPGQIPLSLPSIGDEVPNAVRELQVVDMKTSGGWLVLSLN